MSVSLISEIIGLFFSTLSPDNKYSVLNTENLRQQIQLQLSKKERSFSEFFLLHVWNVHQNLDVLKKDMTLIAYGFPKLLTAKYVVR